MQIDEFDYNLPIELIAQHPTDKRDGSRLMVLDRDKKTVNHKRFYNILDYVNPGDCLVLNNSKVIPARLFGIKEETGAKIEFLLTKRKGEDLWETMVKPGKKVHINDIISFSEDGRLKAEIVGQGQEGTRIVKFIYQGIFMELLEEMGKIPLPPYIDRETDSQDKERYQTVYCKDEGSVAAPTAGLHFTEDLLKQATQKGVKIAYVTLHVGIGTFRPVKCDVIEDHTMHFEEYMVDEKNATIINEAKKAGGRIISVGTTSTRTLESAAVEVAGDVICNDFTYKSYIIKAGSGSTDIFIYPGYKFKMVDSLITNFHLPKSTLLMLISALYNRDEILKAYDIAVAEKYRFFSYGDAMIII